MKLEFSYYEVVGVLVPGFVTLFIGSLAFPAIDFANDTAGVSVGDLGILVLLAYAVGHLVQSLGNMVESAFWWFYGGRPTTWFITDKRSKLLNPAQVDELIRIYRAKHGWAEDGFPDKDSKAEWHPVVRQTFAEVRKSGRADRVEIFNGNYGLFRGLASAFILGIAATVFAPEMRVPIVYAALSAGLVLSTFRMYRFGVYYARELYIQYLEYNNLKVSNPK